MEKNFYIVPAMFMVVGIVLLFIGSTQSQYFFNGALIALIVGGLLTKNNEKE